MFFIEKSVRQKKKIQGSNLNLISDRLGPLDGAALSASSLTRSQAIENPSNLSKFGSEKKAAAVLAFGPKVLKRNLDRQSPECKPTHESDFDGLIAHQASGRFTDLPESLCSVLIQIPDVPTQRKSQISFKLSCHNADELPEENQVLLEEFNAVAKHLSIPRTSSISNSQTTHSGSGVATDGKLRSSRHGPEPKSPRVGFESMSPGKGLEFKPPRSRMELDTPRRVSGTTSPKKQLDLNMPQSGLNPRSPRHKISVKSPQDQSSVRSPLNGMGSGYSAQH